MQRRISTCISLALLELAFFGARPVLAAAPDAADSGRGYQGPMAAGPRESAQASPRSEEAPETSGDFLEPEPLPPSDADTTGGLLEGGDFDESFAGEGGDLLDIAEFDLEQLLGNVTSVSRRQESLAKAPASVSIINRGDIRRSAARTIPDVLRMAPGVQVVQNAPGSFVVSLRGMAGLQGNNVVVLVDGVSVNSVVDRSVDWGNLPVHIDDIERIEIVRGPVSPVYGANAYAGVINIITSEPVAEGLWGSVRAAYGADWRDNRSERVLAAVGGRHRWARWHVAADLWQNARFRDGVSQSNPTAEKYSVVGKSEFELAENHTIHVKGAASRGEHSGLDHLVLESHPQRNNLAYGYIGYTARNLPSVADSFDVWVQGKRLSVEAPANRYEGFSYDGLESADGSAGASFAFDFPYEIGWVLGGDAGIAYVNAPFIRADENAKIRPRYGFFTEASIDAFERLYVTAAIRADDSAMLNRMQWSYRASATYYREQYVIRLSGGSAFREPTFVELGGRFSDPESNLILLEGTAGLASPRVDSVELGGLVLLGHTFTFRPTIYFAYMRDLMVADFEPLVRKSFRNDEGGRPLLGGEFEFSWQFIPSMAWKTTGGVLVWLKQVDDLSATVAVPEQNSIFAMWTGVNGSWIEDRLTMGLGAAYTTPRRYRVRAGIPPQIVDAVVGNLVRPEAVLEYRFLRNQPFWLWIRGSTVLPHGQIESPFPGASLLGTSVLAGVDFRG